MIAHSKNHKKEWNSIMLEKVEKMVDGLKLVVIENPKDLSEETMNAIYDFARDKKLNVIEFRNENGDVYKSLEFSEDAEWSN